MSERQTLPDMFKENLLASFRVLARVTAPSPIEEGLAKKILNDIKPLTDLVAASGRVEGRDKSLFLQAGTSDDGLTKGVVSPTGVTLEETFTFNGHSYRSNIFWNSEKPDVISVYSMPVGSGFSGKSATIVIPLDGNLSNLQEG